MTVSKWLHLATKLLETAKIGTARLDALVLLEDCSGKDRAWLLANPDYELPADVDAKLTKLLSRRARHEPLSYIRGFTEFYGRKFVVNAAVLEPRPESETMIELLKQLIQSPTKGPKTAQTGPEDGSGWHIADVGTGSGVLGITAKLELPEAEIGLLEIDSKALKVAKTNVDLFTIYVTLKKSDLLSAAGAKYDILLCNLPYVPENYRLNRAATLEPPIAIFGGPDGLDIYRKLFKQLKIVGQKPLYILTESFPDQHGLLEQIAAAAGYQQLQEDDFIQVFTPAD